MTEGSSGQFPDPTCKWTGAKLLILLGWLSHWCPDGCGWEPRWQVIIRGRLEWGWDRQKLTAVAWFTWAGTLSPEDRARHTIWCHVCVCVCVSNYSWINKPLWKIAILILFSKYVQMINSVHFHPQMVLLLLIVLPSSLDGAASFSSWYDLSADSMM